PRLQGKSRRARRRRQPPRETGRRLQRAAAGEPQPAVAGVGPHSPNPLSPDPSLPPPTGREGALKEEETLAGEFRRGGACPRPGTLRAGASPAPTLKAGFSLLFSLLSRWAGGGRGRERRAGEVRAYGKIPRSS